MSVDVGPCIFPGCVSRDRHWHGGFPGGYDNPADPDGPPIEFTTEPTPGVRDYNGARMTPAVELMLGSLERAAGQLPSNAHDLTLDELDRAARAVMQLEHALVAEVTRRERQIDREAAIAHAQRVRSAREASASA